MFTKIQLISFSVFCDQVLLQSLETSPLGENLLQETDLLVSLVLFSLITDLLCEATSLSRERETAFAGQERWSLKTGPTVHHGCL